MRVNFRIRTREPANFWPKTGTTNAFFCDTTKQIEWTWSSSLRFCDEDLFFLFWFSPSNLRVKSIPKEDNVGFGANYSPECCRIPNASGFGCVSVPLKVFVPPETHYSGAGLVTILFYLQCMNYTVVCNQMAYKSSWFVLQNASILSKYCDLRVFSNLSNCNYRIFVKEILLEIGFISSNWPATRPHYLFNIGPKKIGPRTIKPSLIKLAYKCTSYDKTSQRSCMFY